MLFSPSTLRTSGESLLNQWPTTGPRRHKLTSQSGAPCGQFGHFVLFAKRLRTTRLVMQFGQEKTWRSRRRFFVQRLPAYVMNELYQLSSGTEYQSEQHFITRFFSFFFSNFRRPPLHVGQNRFLEGFFVLFLLLDYVLGWFVCPCSWLVCVSVSPDI